MGVLKFPQLGLSQLWGSITLRADLQLRWSLKPSYRPCWKFFNGMLQATCTQGNRGRLLTLNSRESNCQFDSWPFFWPWLMFELSNGSHESILNIYVPRTFQWYKELLNPLSFNPCNCFLKTLRLQLPKWKLLWECEGSFPHIFLHS